MPNYRVKWENDIIADSPEDAARIAKEILTDPENTTPLFEISEIHISQTLGVPPFFNIGPRLISGGKNERP